MITNKEVIIEWFISPSPFKDYPDDFGGDWNGYAIVSRDHPDYGKDTNEVNLDVHGGVTYAGPGTSQRLDIPEKYRNENYWIFGFDTSHAGDKRYKWPKERVEKEAAEMASQLYIIQIKHMRGI